MIDKGQRRQTPPLRGRGKGWGLSVEQIDTLHERARSMRNQPTEPEIRLWRHPSNRQLGGFKFRRQAMIGRYIADFLCPQKALIVEVDGITHDAETDIVRDAALARLGYRTVRFTNEQVMREMDGVLQTLLLELNSVSDSRNTPHPNPSPEGEGLLAAQGTAV
ncbi:endonuclease domain-containing protein [Sphingosinicella rhizophila]|uniref:DUF559 domain-containing protein n=1 Tax=Sphingosinicella rhizophila TaxID=3050082 RepID=A0ABU3Q964_9SPHN|nr:DUF559 domain-containing protein [Sphingosinicella sp. GR2756]MDT9599485.1 DUF559 domain-containing protein [Sphingosinicella sp. GR2756]